MSLLSDKIQSFSPQVYRTHADKTISTSAVNTGSITGSTITLSSAANMSWVHDGPSGGDQASWNFNQLTPSIFSCRVNTTHTATVAEYSDRDYTLGLWIKFISFPTNSNNNVLITTGGGTAANNSGFTLGFYGTGSTTNGRKLYSSVSNGSVFITTIFSPQLVLNTWHYIAARRIGSTVNYYLDGVYIGTNDIVPTTAASGIGYGGIAAYNPSAYVSRISHFHLGSTANFTVSAIEEIWAEGNKGFVGAVKALPTPPVNWWPLNEGTSDQLLNYGSTGGTDQVNGRLDLSGSSPTAYQWITGEVEGGIQYNSAWAGYDSNPGWAPTTAGEMTINFWFKKSAPPATAQQWLNWFYNSTSNINSVNEAGINTDGSIIFKPQWSYSGGPYTQSQVSTNINVCDNNWHMITITYEGALSLAGTMKMYVDGQLKSTASDWGNSSASSSASITWGTASTSWDEFQTYSYRLTAAQILSLYEAEYPPSTGGYPLKYWNGSAWTTPISMQQWNGTAWVTMDGSVYNGTTWVDIV